ncbi:MAG: NAD(+)/NADH kinase [Desulfotignum sp.]|jgi:NAD+ kinase|nr:NAD(+)/NADH kinase [Desulfotignum sp.]
MEKKRIGIFVKPQDDAQKKAGELVKKFGDKVIIIDSRQSADTRLPDDMICVLVLGGDGTFLSAARLIGERDIPLLGTKFGEVGFLAIILEEHLYGALEHVFKGAYIIHRRARLNIRLVRGDVTLADVDVLNDAVINKSALSRLASCAVYLDNIYLTTFRADGLIVATPTGSTAYSLAAGGPVVHPAVPSIILTPICPFTLTNRPLLIPDTTAIEIRLEDRPEDIVLTLDGQEGFEMGPDDRIFISKSPHDVKLIAFEEQSYFKVLKTRLHWSGGRS